MLYILNDVLLNQMKGGLKSLCDTSTALLYKTFFKTQKAPVAVSIQLLQTESKFYLICLTSVEFFFTKPAIKASQIKKPLGLVLEA